MARTLLLNADYAPLSVVSARRAMVLLLSEKAEMVESNGAMFRSANLSYPSPVIIRLQRYVHVPFRRSIPLTTRAVLARDKYVCGYCSGEATTTDHIIPRSRGGKHDWLNVVACCYPCNHKKGKRLLEDIGWELRIKPKVPRGTSIWVLSLAGRAEPAWATYLDA